MRKSIKTLSFFGVLYFASIGGLLGCGNNGIEYEELPVINLQDKYRSIYQIMPIAYADSNNDGAGDLRGIIDNLDYIDSMNYTGIWLTPIHPSETYHKYDVDNYKQIDPTFGTLEDYDELVTKLHEKKMTMILDLVINHSSDSNRWFIDCVNAHKNHLYSNHYYNYYNVIEVGSGSAPSGYTKTGNFAYESRFWSGMPDLNLQNVLDEPDGYLANDLKDIFRYWLVDHKVDGFRLDAVTSYFTGNEGANLAFLGWLNKECKAIKPDCYIVGEAAWSSSSPENKRYQSSGIDSFFNFGNHAASGYVAQVVNGDASFFSYALKKNKDTAADGIEAPFVANHDTGHMIGAVRGRSSVNNLKFAHGVLSMLNGTTYTYYGDEIGLAVPPGTNGQDEDKRLPMNFGNSYTCKPQPGHTKYVESDVYPYGSVQDQIKDPNSVVNYVKKANLIRKQLSGIARGEFKVEFLSPNETFIVVSKKYNNIVIYIAMNANPNASYTYKYSTLGNVKPITELCTVGNCVITDKENSNIEIPKQGIVIFR